MRPSRIHDEHAQSVDLSQGFEAGSLPRALREQAQRFEDELIGLASGRMALDPSSLPVAGPGIHWERLAQHPMVVEYAPHAEGLFRLMLEPLGDVETAFAPLMQTTGPLEPWIHLPRRGHFGLRVVQAAARAREQHAQAWEQISGWLPLIPLQEREGRLLFDLWRGVAGLLLQPPREQDNGSLLVWSVDRDSDATLVIRTKGFAARTVTLQAREVRHLLRASPETVTRVLDTAYYSSSEYLHRDVCRVLLAQ